MTWGRLSRSSLIDCKRVRSERPPLEPRPGRRCTARCLARPREGSWGTRQPWRQHQAQGARRFALPLLPVSSVVHSEMPHGARDPKSGGE